MSANPDRVREIFGKAARMPEDARAVYIRVACGHDAALQGEVESLLEQANSSTTQLSDDQPPSDPMIGVQVGQYIIKSLIGSGGMGIVYRCTQQSPRRTVAIKMMKQGVASRNALRRFEFESEALGRLRHENIAQIYEASTWDDGSGARPFFAMEYLAGGKPITQYVREKELGTHERLEMFMKVCDAVQHGHQKGIIHRDLKPHNILVTSNGVPKIIDFGVARSTNSDMAATTLQSDIGALIGTLQYMSPEQCGGDPSDIDVRSDVYTLGVVLYELLCESLPYDVKNIAIAEAVRIVQQNQPSKPSTVNKRLRGDIETVVMMTLEKDRDRRYQTAVELKQDIDRYLTNTPIAARRPSAWYHIKRFATRHRATAATMIISVGILLASIGAISILWLDATNARLEAEESARRADTEATNARQATDKAEREAKNARQATDKAEREAKNAEDARDQQQRTVFHASTMAAFMALESNAMPTAKTYLKKARKAKLDEHGDLPDLDQMPFEFRHLQHLANSGGPQRDSIGLDDEIAGVTGYPPPVTAIAISPDGGRIASGYNNGTIGILDTVMSDSIVTLGDDHDGSKGPAYKKVRSVSFNCDGTKLASTTLTAIRIWDTRTGELTRTLDSPDETDLCKGIFSPRGNFFAYTSMGGTIHIWDTELDEPNPLEEFEPAGIDNQNTKDRGNIDICFNFDGTQLARGFKSKISIMNIEDEKIIWRHSLDDKENSLDDKENSLDDKEMNSMAFHPDGDQLAILTRSKKRFDVIDVDDIEYHDIEYHGIEIFDVTTRNGDEAIKFDLDGQANSIAFSPDGTRLAVSTDKLVGLWDLDLEEQVFFFPREGLRSQLNRDPIVAFSPNNNYLASGWDENVRLWRTSATTSSMLYMNDLENDLEECAEKLIKESTGEDDIVDDDTVLLLLEKESKNLTAKEQTAIQNLVLKKMVERRKQLSSKTESDNASSTLPVAPDVRSEPTKTTLQSTRENDQDPGD